MTRSIIISFIGLVSGIAVGFLVIKSEAASPSHIKQAAPKQIIGFLPYWQLEKVNQNDVDYLTTLTYFGLNVDEDGHIVKLANEQQEDPGWYDLHSEKLGTILNTARNKNIKLSLLISMGDADVIHKLVNKPTEHAKALVKDVMPIMKKYHFTDLNLDIEDTSNASPAAQKQFTQFVHTIREQVINAKLGTLTLEISTADTVTYNLINIAEVVPYADSIVLMAYDFHSPDSIVTGPVAPLNGAGKNSEYDVTTAVERSLQIVPPNKLVLGMPLYGYEWETLNNAIRSAIIPGSGVLASNNRTESLITTCASCSAFFDSNDQEAFIQYQETATGSYHQFSVPNAQSVQAKIALANKEGLTGVALWALGYESKTMLTPLANYK